jgi:LacI family gluconate utilization system Gnt-I transcriptional repressor
MCSERTVPRIEDVARRAGTSAITVSRALRLPDLVSEKTRARVLEAVEALGYVPNHSASSLASRRSGLLGVLVPTIGNSIFAETVRGLSDAVGARGLQILLGDYGYSQARERDLLRMLAGRQPEGMVLVGLVTDPAQRRLLAGLKIPVVETWDLTADPIDTVVGFSNRAAGAAVAAHFLRTGRRRLAFGGGSDPRAAARAEGFAAAVTAEGAVPAIRVHRSASVGVAAGGEVLAAVLARAPDVDALFCANDALAVGAMLAAQAAGIAVPERLAVVGLGDLDLGRAMRPALTTISVVAHEIGRRAGAAILARLAGNAPEPRVIDLGFELIVRESG